MFSLQILTLCFLVFLLAGAVKGIIGLGLPTVSLALLSVVIDLPTAIALLLAPSLVTNIWQAAAGGNAALVLRRIWPFLLTATVSIWLGALALTRINLDVLSALLGIILVIYAALNLLGYRLAIRQEQEIWMGPLAGTVNGILTGMTGSFVVPGVMYLQAIGLPRDILIQAMGLLFTVSTLALGFALQGNRLLSTDLVILSAASVLPAILGMYLGNRLRRRLTEHRFRRVFFGALLSVGIYIVIRVMY